MSEDQAGVVSARVRQLYDDIGWKESDGVTFDAQTGEDLRPSSAAYLSATRLRVTRHLPNSGDRIMDMASGPIQYPEYLEYSRGFSTRVCVDLSQRALDMAQAKIGHRGEYLCGDFLELPLEPDSLDAAVSLHTIYHIHASRQAAAVRKLVQLVKPGGTVVIVYSNPDNLVSTFARPLRKLLGRVNAKDSTQPSTIYFEPQPLRWWRQFEDVAEVKLFPWRTLSTPVQKRLIPSGSIGRTLLRWLFKLEDRFPRFFTRIGVYPMVVLRKPVSVR